MRPQTVHLMLALVHGIALCATLGADLAAAPDRRARGRRAAVWGTAAVAFAAVMAWVDPASLPLAWLAPLQEGTTDTLVRLARGEGSHGGPATQRLYVPWFVGTVRRLDVLVRFELAAAAAATVGLAAGLRRATGSAGATAALLGAWVLSPMVRWPALSEGPAPTAWLGLIGLAACVQAMDRGGRGLRGVAGLGALACTGVVAANRPELVALPLAWAAVQGGRALGLDRGLRRGLRAGARAWGRLQGVPRIAAGLAVGVGLVITVPDVAAWGRLGWFLQAAHPLDPSPLYWTLALGAFAGPGVAVLAVRGTWRALRRPGGVAALGLGAVALSRVYFGAAHGGIGWPPGAVSVPETLRYGGLLAPAIWGLAALGIADLSGRVRTVALVAALIPGWTGAVGLWPGAFAPSMPWAAPWDRDAQAEVRLVVGALRDRPSCAVLARRPPSGDGPGDWIVFVGPSAASAGGGLRTVTVPASATPAEAAARAPVPVDCATMLVGAGCQLRDRPDCADDLQGLGPADRVDGLTRPARPYAHPQHRWDTVDPVELALYDVTPAPPAGQAGGPGSGQGP